MTNDLQFKRVANAVLPPRLRWKLASVIAAAAFLFGAFGAGLVFLIRTRRTKPGFVRPVVDGALNRGRATANEGERRVAPPF